MDPKLSNLDPKLQEAYNRVMNGPAAPPPGQNPVGSSPMPAQAPQPNPQSQIQPQFQQPPPAPAAPADFNTAVPQPPPTQQPYSPNTIPGINSTVAFNASDNQKNQGTTAVKRGRMHGLMPVLAGIAIVFLLIAYTFVWIILFNVQVPYLPQF